MKAIFILGLCGSLLIFIAGCREGGEETKEVHEEQKSYSPRTVDVIMEDVIFLSDVEPVSSEQDYGSLNNDKSVNGSPIRIGEYIYDKGLGTHANSELVYKIPSKYSYFKAEIGLDVERAGGSIVFKVYVDDKLMYESPKLTGSDGTVNVEVPLKKRSKELRLVVGDAGDGIECDHADWAVARFARPK